MAITLDSFMASLGGAESGNNYGATNKDSGAHGKYQIMPGNWPAWSREAGLAGAPQTPENQEKVARYKIKQYYDQTGDWRDVAALWYSGRTRAQLGQEGLNRGQGQYPTINDYINKIVGGAEGASGGSGVSQQSTSSSTYQGSTYWSDRVDQINDQIQQLEDYRDVAKSFPRGDELVRSVDAEIQNLQGMRDEAHMFAQEEQAAAADMALTGAQIDVQRINAAVAEGRLTLDQAIHELNKELDRRQQKLNEETMRRNQGRADAEFIQSELNEAAAWAPSEPGKTDYSGADVSEAHGQALAGRGISPDSTIAQYSGTRNVNPQQTLAQAGGGAKGSAPGQGWRDEDRTQPEAEATPGPPATGGGAPGSSRSSVPPSGHPASTSPPPTSSTPNFDDSTPPTGHPAGRQPPNFSDSTPPMGHPAGSPAPQAPPTGLGRRPGDPLPTPPQYEPPNRASPTSPSHAGYRSPRFPDEEDDGLLDRRRRNSTPPPGHPAGAPGGSLLLRR